MQKGSIVRCIGHGQWMDVDSEKPAHGPEFEDITVISGFQRGDYLEFEEYPEIQFDGLPNAWHKRWFEEMQPPMTVEVENIISETQSI